jgi:actin related protein 2/3 complex subunit 1A/1B
LTFASESSIVAAGHDCQPVVFTGSSSGWSFSHSLDDPANIASKGLTPAATGARASTAPGRLNNEAFNLFKQADTRGVSRSSAGGNTPSSAGMAAVGADGLLLTVHQNSITWIDAYEWASKGDVAKVSTAGRDGKLVIWNVTKK